MGEFDTERENHTQKGVINSLPDSNLEERPFLILDVRELDEYNTCHLISG